MVWIYHSCYLDPLFHAAPWSVDPVLLSTAKYGYLVVPLFFMISGFVIASSALRRSRLQFASARLWRLFPAFSLCLAVTIVVLVLEGRPPSFKVLLANLTMLPRIFGQPYIDGVYWSLMFEIIFYAYVWIFLLGASFESRLRIFVVLWLIASLVHAWHPLPGKVLLILDWAPYFAVGCFCWLYLRNRRHLDAALLGLTVTGASVVAAAQTQHDPLVASLVVAALAGLFIWMIGVQVSPRLHSLAIVLGAMSYPLYLLHNEFGGWVTRTSGSFVLSFGIVVSSCYLVTVFESRIRNTFRPTTRSS